MKASTLATRADALDILRQIAATAAEMPPCARIDPDLAAEAGMDGNLGRLLQAARNIAAPTE